jgi:hypothetical protein
MVTVLKVKLPPVPHTDAESAAVGSAIVLNGDTRRRRGDHKEHGIGASEHCAVVTHGDPAIGIVLNYCVGDKTTGRPEEIHAGVCCPLNGQTPQITHAELIAVIRLEERLEMTLNPTHAVVPGEILLVDFVFKSFTG